MSAIRAKLAEIPTPKRRRKTRPAPKRTRRAAQAPQSDAADLGERMLLRVATSAHALDTPEPTVRAWIAAGRLPCVRIGRAVYVEPSELLKFIKRHRAAK